VNPGEDVVFADRRAAGRALAAALHEKYRAVPDLLVLALPRGGVPVAFEVARELHAELDILIVRKLGAPQQPELAIGAIATGGAQVLNRELIADLGLSKRDVAAISAAETEEMQRREIAYRGDRRPPAVENRTVIVVDDGLATGATMAAAIAALRQRGAARLVVAVPVAPRDTAARLDSLADDIVCLHTPQWFQAVGQWYRDFRQTDDHEVRELLHRARSQQSPLPPVEKSAR